MTTPDVTFRPVTEEDLEFLCELYGDTRREELAAVPWTDAEKRDFLRMQFEAQHRFYQSQFPNARFDLLICDGQKAGRLYVDRRPDEIRLIDIALLSGFRNRGLGGRLLRELLQEARQSDKPVRIHVEKFNPAMRLYERLGFRRLGDAGVHWLMEWTPS